MRLIRNTTPDGRCKYALVRLDKIRNLPIGSELLARISIALDELAADGVLEYAGKNDPEEAFTIKLKDINAPEALFKYAEVAAEQRDFELAQDVRELAERALNHPDRKQPD